MRLWRLSNHRHAADLSGALLLVPSAIIPLEGTPDVNVLINPRHKSIGAMTIARSTAFSLDLRLFS